MKQIIFQSLTSDQKLLIDQDLVFITKKNPKISLALRINW